MKEELYQKAAMASYYNSVQLLQEAEILLNFSRNERSYALSVLALEEFAKSFLFKCMACDLIEDPDFLKDLTFHDEKIFHGIHILVSFFATMGVQWAMNYSKVYDGNELDHSKHIFPDVMGFAVKPVKEIIKELKNAHKKKLDALYVGVKSKKLFLPQNTITVKDTRKLYNLLDSTIHGFNVILEKNKEDFIKMVKIADPQIFSGTIKSDFKRFQK